MSDPSAEPTRQKLILFTGPPCSGKTHLAELFERETGAPVIEMDLVRQAILPDSVQSKADRNTAYRAMHYSALRQFEVGAPQVVLVATYRPPEQRQNILDLQFKFENPHGKPRRNLPVFLIQCVVDPDTAVRRFLQRPPGHAAVDLTESAVREHARSYPYFPTGCIVDTSSLRETEALALIRKCLEEGKPVKVAEWLRDAGRAV